MTLQDKGDFAGVIKDERFSGGEIILDIWIGPKCNHKRPYNKEAEET